ncbi:hypothetical protein J2847_003355 [Azospirillum agricola]|nr:hypothetical protein [Azospirillum agricola]MBP2230052.1 hypothetical protein [Azospirillum agricola]
MRPRVERYLAGVRDYRRARHELDASTRRSVRERWAFAFERWGYPA